MPNYNQYTANQFIQDPLFLEWVYENTPSSAAFWDDWISRKPSNLEEFLQPEQALRILNAIFSSEISAEDSDCNQIQMHLK